MHDFHLTLNRNNINKVFYKKNILTTTHFVIYILERIKDKVKKLFNTLFIGYKSY